MTTTRSDALAVVREQLLTAAATKKCHSCGCLHQTVAALRDGPERLDELADVFPAAQATFEPKRYDCLGCAVCYPAIAANAFAEAFPAAAGQLDLCPTEAPDERAGWPPLAGDYQVVRYRGTVAVCTLNSETLAKSIADLAPDGVAVVGTMQTENLGIERLIRNVLANRNIRHLVLCGDDTRQAIGHLPGQSLDALVANGVDDGMRIVGARGKRPILKNVTASQVEMFRRQIALVSLVGTTDEGAIVEAIAACEARALGPFDGETAAEIEVDTVVATEPRRLVPDPAGYFVVYPDRRQQKIVVEHYENRGALTIVIEGTSPAAVYAEIVGRDLISRLDHAAYLGRELARAEHALRTGEPYTQDRAAGEIEVPPTANDCGCGPKACGGSR